MLTFYATYTRKFVHCFLEKRGSTTHGPPPTPLLPQPLLDQYLMMPHPYSLPTLLLPKTRQPHPLLYLPIPLQVTLVLQWLLVIPLTTVRVSSLTHSLNPAPKILKMHVEPALHIPKWLLHWKTGTRRLSVLVEWVFYLSIVITWQTCRDLLGAKFITIWNRLSLEELVCKVLTWVLLLLLLLLWLTLVIHAQILQKITLH